MILRSLTWLVACVALASIAEAAPQGNGAAPPRVDGPRRVVRVFVLAGQSNMEGKAQNALLDRQATAEGTREFYAHLRDGDRWRVRDDAFIKFFGRRGALTTGFGSPDRTGVELEFGTVLSEHYDDPVLLIKTAWGGRSIDRDFRPPSSGLPPMMAIEAEHGSAVERKKKQNADRGKSEPLPTIDEILGAYGADYRAMIAEVRATLADVDQLFPELDGYVPELTGFVWFQGWNDQYGGAETRYEEHLRHLIVDVRRDLNAPELPVVVGAMGQNGSRPAKGPMLAIQKAQLAMNDVGAFQGNVRTIRTDVLVDTAAEELYPRWKEEREAWDRTGSDHAYHYLGSGIWFTRIGRAMAEAMLELVE